VAGTGLHWLYQGAATSAGTNTCFVIAKAGTASFISIGFGGLPTAVGAYFNLSTGAVGTVNGAGLTSSIKALANGFYLCSLTDTTGSRTFHSFGIHTSDNQVLNWNAAGTETIILWGSQNENGASFASSYIPTTTVSVTRAGDIDTYAYLSNLNLTQGSVYLEVAGSNIDEGAHLFSLRSASGDVPIYYGSGQMRFFQNGAYRAIKAFTPSASVQKIVATWGANGLSICVNGTTPVTGTFSGTLSAGNANMGVGVFTGGSLVQPFANIRNVKIYFQQLSSTQQQAMTS
jgi:hypothetical protein